VLARGDAFYFVLARAIQKPRKSKSQRQRIVAKHCEELLVPLRGVADDNIGRLTMSSQL
jgi:acyl transferase domain-containing protein